VSFIFHYRIQIQISKNYRRPPNSHWARVVGYGPFSLWVIHKEGLCLSSGDINRLMMIMMITGIKIKTIREKL
jgi:hypothetical protein